MTEFRCKHCGSLNLELEEKGNQTGLYCCDCGKWLKWVTKEEKRVFNNKNACTPIYIPEGATNGDMIMAMFPNCEQKEHMNNRCWKMIAIKGMKMPSGCEVCDFRKSDPYSGEEYCSKAIGSNIIIYEKERLENCPLVEVVTCKDCKYYRNGLEHCTQWVMPTNDDFYCADAERRK